MKKVEPEIKDELRAEYDFRNVRVRKLSVERRSFGDTVRLEPDVAEVFSNAHSVNEALRFLTRITKEKHLELFDIKRS